MVDFIKSHCVSRDENMWTKMVIGLGSVTRPGFWARAIAEACHGSKRWL